jgi:tetratricopeptide (TPR) repeat protein
LKRSWAIVLCAIAALACSQEPASLAEIQTLVADGDADAAVEQIRESLARDPNQPELQLLYGQILAQFGHLSLAIWPLRKAAEFPGHARAANLMLAQVLLRSGSPDDAIAAATRVLDSVPDDREALRVRASAYQAVSREEDALADVDRILDVDPDDLDAQIARTIALLGLERVEDAESALETAQWIADQREPVAEPLLARLCLAEAMFEAERGNPTAGDELLRGCLERHPGDQNTVLQAVRIYAGSSRRALAESTLRNAIDEAPLNLLFRTTLADLLRLNGNLEEAESVLLDATRIPELGALPWLALFDHYSATDDHTAALAAIEKVRAFGDLPVLLQLAYADTLVLVGDHSGAELAAQELPEGYQSLVRGRILLRQGEAQMALATLREGIRHWPDNATARSLAGQAAEQAGLLQEAVSHYREAIRSDASQTDAGLRLAGLLEAVGDSAGAYDAALRHFSAHPNDIEGAVMAARLADLVGAHNSAAQVLARMSNIPGARPDAVAARAIMAGARAGARSKTIEVILKSGLDLKSPSNAVPLEVLLAALSAEGESSQALSRVDLALAEYPEASVLHLLRGRTLLAAGRRREARASFEEAVELDPEHSEALLELARLAAETDRDEALSLYERASAHQDSHAAAYEACVLHELADQVEGCLARVLETHPLSVHAAMDLAERIASRGGDLERAEELARRAIQLQGGSRAIALLGRILVDRGEFEAAVATLQRVIERDQEAHEAQYQLGRALIGLGDLEGAARSIRRALEGGEPFAGMEEARTDLARLESRSPREVQ